MAARPERAPFAGRNCSASARRSCTSTLIRAGEKFEWEETTARGGTPKSGRKKTERPRGSRNIHLGGRDAPPAYSFQAALVKPCCDMSQSGTRGVRTSCYIYYVAIDVKQCLPLAFLKTGTGRCSGRDSHPNCSRDAKTSRRIRVLHRAPRPLQCLFTLCPNVEFRLRFIK
jgi:hypothetical protein